MSLLTTFDHQQYLNLETFRKNGSGVKTTFWFVEDGGRLFVRTDVASGKVKRIRINCQVHIAPCKMDGTILGDWIEASARVVEDKEIDRKVDRMLEKKHGLMKTFLVWHLPYDAGNTQSWKSRWWENERFHSSSFDN